MHHALSRVAGVCLMVAALGSWVRATETENLGIQIFPAGPVEVDGKLDDWVLTGGTFACSDVENQRDKFGVWVHTMYDAQNLYVLARWNDETPLNNPGSTKGDYGFAGDALQFRTITAQGTPQERGQHFTAWRDRDNVDVIKIEQGTSFKEGVIENAKKDGAQQAFAINADKKGYVQEIAIPWKLLTRDGQALKAGDRMNFTVEPNYTIGIGGRVSLKDIFKPGITPDRVFTFMAATCWGYGTLEAAAAQTPRSQRLADGREFSVHMEGGLPVVDWTGLIKVRELKGFKTVAFTMPEDGYISLNIRGQDGAVVRQLLTCEFMTKGPHEVKWDGLTTLNWRTPGKAVPAGEYTWDAIWHKGIGVALRGWACNGGNAPWDSSVSSNWGGDHGQPVACASDATKVYLGWSGAEAGKALLACDLKGGVQWKNNRGGMAGAELVAVDNGTVYAQNWGGDLYRVDSTKGGYTSWAGTDTTDLFIKTLWGDEKGMPEKADALAAAKGKLFLGFTKANLVLVLDAQSGKLIKRITVTEPRDLEPAGDQLYVISEGKSVLSLDVATGQTKPAITGLNNASALAVDKDGRIYVGEREPANQVKVFTPDGKAVSTIGREGGRALLGKWTPEGMAFINGMTVDAEGKLWVAEADMSPKRMSVWDTKTGQLVREFFGPATYGALGGAINPMDPDLMVGQGCEWRLDPKTGRDTCLGVITRDGMEVSRFGTGSNGRLYLAVAPGWIHGSNAIRIFERVGDANYKLRSMFIYEGKDKTAKTIFWADQNDDGQRQVNEETTIDGQVTFSSWYMGLTPDMTIYAGSSQYKVAGFTACGAPQYDLSKPTKMPTAGLGSADGKLVLRIGEYNTNNSWNSCYDIATGKLVWTYPDNFVGVHGSHNAVPAEVGMIRGSYGPCGVAKLPDPIGNVWIIATNVGEWHILTERGYYLTRLFQGDAMKIQWPEQAMPGASMDNCPPGMGGEDFGGSATLTKDGRLCLQAGKTGFWNLQVTGLETVKPIPGSTIAISADDVKQAQAYHEQYLQAAVGTPQLSVKKMTPALTGNLDSDFKGAQIISYKKQDEAAVRSAAAWDDQNLYVAWDVKDNTPWVNGATEASQMYIGGDTVDLQLGTDPGAKKDRNDAVAGDLRLSIGSLKGQPTAVIYRKVSADKKAKVFSSGVVKSYPMDYVDVVAGATFKIKPSPGKGYIVEASIPLASLGIKPASGLKLRGDFGVTHGDPAGERTRLRSYWANQHTGIVDDAVFELMMEPKNWGEISFSE